MWNIPSRLSQLTFGRYFDQLLTIGVLPSIFSQLAFGYYYNQPLTFEVLP